MRRRHVKSFLIGSLCSVAFACGPTQRIDLCRRGDRIDVTSFRLTAFDADGAVLDQWTASADHASTSDGPVDGTRRVHVEGLDASGAVVAYGDATIAGDSVCMCVASSTQYPVACDDVSCHMISGRCTFTDREGGLLGARSYSFGDNTTDDITAVTTDTFLGGDPIEQGTNFGGRLSVKIAADPAAPRVGLWRFDLRAVPSTAQVTRATLALTTGADSTTNPVDVYEVLEDWEAGTGLATPGCSNWSCRTLQGGQQDWTTPGAGSPGSSAATPLLSIYPALVATRYETESEPLRQLVQTWIRSPADNHGITARMMPSTSTTELVSSEGADGARPELLVEILVPPDPQ